MNYQIHELLAEPENQRNEPEAEFAYGEDE
jgi:hypothetical protein